MLGMRPLSSVRRSSSLSEFASSTRRRIVGWFIQSVSRLVVMSAPSVLVLRWTIQFYRVRLRNQDSSGSDCGRRDHGQDKLQPELLTRLPLANLCTRPEFREGAFVRRVFQGVLMQHRVVVLLAALTLAACESPTQP